MSGIIGKKIGMSSVFNSDGESVPVTVILPGLFQLFRLQQLTWNIQPKKDTMLTLIALVMRTMLRT